MKTMIVKLRDFSDNLTFITFTIKFRETKIAGPFHDGLIKMAESVTAVCFFSRKTSKGFMNTTGHQRNKSWTHYKGTQGNHNHFTQRLTRHYTENGFSKELFEIKDTGRIMSGSHSGLKDFMVLTKNMVNENHIDNRDAFKSVAMWYYNSSDAEVENWYFLFSHVVMLNPFDNTTNKPLAVRLFHETVVSWDANLSRHCTFNVQLKGGSAAYSVFLCFKQEVNKATRVKAFCAKTDLVRLKKAAEKPHWTLQWAIWDNTQLKWLMYEPNFM